MLATRVSGSAKRRPRSGNFNALVTLLKQNIHKGIKMASYLTHTCPRCKHFLGVVVREPSVGRTARSVRGFCLRCRYQLNWKLFSGRLFRHPVRSSYPHGPERPQTRAEQRRTLSVIKPKVLGPLSYQNPKSIV